MPASKTYKVTPDQFAALVEQLGKAGITISGTSGAFNPPNHPEIALGWSYANGLVQITVLRSAWYESAGAIWSNLDPYFPTQD